MDNIDFDKECWICGVNETYNVCPSCCVEIFIADNGKKGTNKILQHLKDTDITRFNQMVKQAPYCLRWLSS